MFDIVYINLEVGSTGMGMCGKHEYPDKYRQGTKIETMVRAQPVHHNNVAHAACSLVYQLIHCGYLRSHTRW